MTKNQIESLRECSFIHIFLLAALLVSRNGFAPPLYCYFLASSRDSLQYCRVRAANP